MQVWNILHAARWKYRTQNLAKNRHLRTIVQICWAISSQLRQISTIGKKLVKQQYLLHMSSQYVELRPTNGWERLTSLGHPCKFQLVSHLGSVTARHSSSWYQPDFAALNRGRHLYSAGRPSRWALAHILICEDLGWQSCAMVPRWRFFGEFLRHVFSASRVQHVSDLHLKLALRPHHVWKYGGHPICDGWD